MGRLLLIAFLLIPIAEIGVFIQVGGLLGLWPTLGLVVATAVAGSWLLRRQGLAALSRLRGELDAGRFPTEALFDGVCLLFAGVLLLTPGFLTDAVGLALFVPQLRTWLRQRAARSFRTDGARFRIFGMDGRGPRGPQGRPGRGPTIDGEYQDLSETRPGEETRESSSHSDEPRRHIRDRRS